MTLSKLMNEMPNVFTGEVEPKYIDIHLIELIVKHEDSIRQVKGDVYVIALGKFEVIYLIKKGDNIVGATHLKPTSFCGKSYLQPMISKKFENKYPNLLLKLYKQASISLKVPILSDSSQSLDSSTVWRKWFNNPKKYNLKVEITNTKDCKDKTLYSELDIWGETNKEHMLVSIENV